MACLTRGELATMRVSDRIKGPPMISNHHAKYYAYQLHRTGGEGTDRLGRALFDAAVDLNPHQIEAALFALRSPLSQGCLLADEVGLGKTIEAGIVLCQYWAERKRRLLIICPASLRKQWAMELQEKFNLPALVLDSKILREAKRAGRDPFDGKSLVILSYPFAYRMGEELKRISWDLAVIDEAHKLRNAYRPGNKIGQGIRWATEGCRKLLLTATPLQNSLLELYGLSTLIDEHLFGDVNAFRTQFANTGGDLLALRRRISTFCKRTLRSQVLEYVPYTERRAFTQPFSPSDDEHALYESVSSFLQREDSYAIPLRQRHLTGIILRKLLASSSPAVAGTLMAMKTRLENLRDDQVENDPSFAEALVAAEEFDDELLDEILIGEEADIREESAETPAIDPAKLGEEITLLDQLAAWAGRIGTDTKTRALLSALELGFQNTPGRRKALVFTESRRTQDYLKNFLEQNGYRGKLVLFNGTNSGPEITAIYDRWLVTHAGTDRVTGSRDVDVRAAIIEYFRDEAEIMIATEAAAEGVNLQFCSLVINYDLPWNPQRIEQRIGRCHRYGQKHDVVVINFLNERNHADRRVLELLTEKFKLFHGVFGASDEVLGTIESGVDFEKRILAIYQECRTPEQIEAAFAALQKELEEQIKERLTDTREMLLEHFDDDVHERLRLRLEDTKAHLDRFGRRFWSLTCHLLEERAAFDEADLSFILEAAPAPGIPTGRYHLISKTRTATEDGSTELDLPGHLYRLSHPLGEFVIDRAKSLPTPVETVTFDVTNHPTRLHVIELLRGRSGWLALDQLSVQSFEREEYLLFSAFADDSSPLDQETCEKLFLCSGHPGASVEIPAEIASRLAAESKRHAAATINRSLETNNRHFHEAREKLEKWAEDMVFSAEKALRDTKDQIKALSRQARQAPSLAEQHDIQEKIRKLERHQRRQRQEIFDAEDQILEKRDALIDSLERRLSQETTTETLFTLRWSVI